MGSEQRLAGQVALVTGSTSGIGASIARRFTAEGAQVVVTGRDVERGAALAEMCNTQGPGAAYVPTDLADEGAATALVGAAAARFGGLTVVVNAAGACDAAGEDGPVGELSTATWEATFRINATAPFWICRVAVHHLLESGGGSILNLSAAAASRGADQRAAHLASKGALEALTRSVAADYGELGIRCNALALDGEHPDADRVAATAAWLVSDDAASTNGVVLPLQA